MKKVKELTNEELLNRYFYYRTKYEDLDYSEEYIKHVEKQFERAEEEVLRRMGEKENEARIDWSNQK